MSEHKAVVSRNFFAGVVRWGFAIAFAFIGQRIVLNIGAALTNNTEQGTSNPEGVILVFSTLTFFLCFFVGLRIGKMLSSPLRH